MRYPRADWAASVPWAGVTGKPESLDQVNVDLSAIRAQLAALATAINGNGNGTAQSWVSADVSLTIGTLEPLQSVSETYSVPALSSGTPLIVNSLGENLWLMAYGHCVEDGSARVIVQNVGPTQATPGTLTFRITYLANA